MSRDCRQLLWIGSLSAIACVAIILSQESILGHHWASETSIFSKYAIDLLAHLVLYGAYAWLLLLCHRGQIKSPRALKLAVAFPVLFNLGLVFTRPYLSVDFFSYLAHGYMAGELGLNPSVAAVNDLPLSSYWQQLMSWGWIPLSGRSPYGPIWTYLEVALYKTTDSVRVAMILEKLLLALSTLVTASLIARILERIEPKRKWVGVLFFLWNPVVLFEIAGEGHNDMIMILFLMAGIAFAVQKSPGRSLVAYGIAALTKFSSLLTLPVQLAFLYWTRPKNRSLLHKLVPALAVVAGVSFLLYRRFWQGAETFDVLRIFLGFRPRASILGVLFGSEERRATGQFLHGLLQLLLAGFIGLSCWKARDPRAMVRSCAWVVWGYVMLVTSNYWPWYTVLPLALMALSPDTKFLKMGVVMTLMSRVIAPLDVIKVQGNIEWNSHPVLTMLIAIVVPVFHAAWLQKTPRSRKLVRN